MRARNLLIIAVTLLVIMGSVQNIFAQDTEEETCDQFAQRITDDLWINCTPPTDTGDAVENSICYGYQKLETMFADDQGELNSPGDWASLTGVDRIKGVPFNLTRNEWGLALLYVQAYVGEIDGEVELTQVKYLTLGNVELEQADEPAFDANNVLLIDADHPAPMQRAYLRTGEDESYCEEIPEPTLLVQNPYDDEKPVRITINSAEVELQSTVLFRTLQPMYGRDQLAARTLRLITLNGMAIVDPDGARLLVPPGYYVDFCLAPPQNLGLDQHENDQIISCAPSNPLPLTELELVRLRWLERLPHNILHPIDVPQFRRRSGLGGPIFTFVFENPQVLNAARTACENGLLPDRICQVLFF